MNLKSSYKNKKLKANFIFSLSGPITILEISESIYDLIGYKPEDFFNGKQLLKTQIHRDDNDIYNDIFSNQNLPKFNQAFIKNFNLRVRNKNGTIVCIKAICKKEFINPDSGPTLELTLQDGKSLWKKQGPGDFSIEFKSMMENTNDYIYFKDRNHVFTGASQTLVSLTYPSEHWTDLLGKTDYDVFPEEYADHYYSLEKQVFAGIPVAHRIQETLDNDGNKGWVDNRKFPIFGENKEIIGLFGIARIVTESIEAQESLKRSQKNLLEANKKNEQILNAIGEGIYGLDINGRTTFVNPAAEKMLEYSLQEMQEKSQHDLIHHTKSDGSPNPFEDCKIYKTFSTGKIEHADDEVFWTKNGTSFPVEYIATPIIENNKVKGAVVSFNDISKRLNSEKLAHVSQSRFKILFEEAPIGVGLLDSITGHIYEVNNKFAEIAGRSKEELKSLRWMDFTHPEDINEDMSKYQNLKDGKIDRYKVEKRYVRPDGTDGWISKTVAKISVDDNSESLHLAMIEDITGQKQYEEKIRNYQIHLEDEIHKRTLELKNSLLRFKSYFELPLIGVAITSPQKGWIEVNQKLCDILGYKHDELFELTWAQLTHPDDIAIDVSNFDRVLLGELEGYSLDKRFIRKNKTVAYTEISVSCVRKLNGDVDYFVALINDISERIQAEKKVKETQERLIHSEKLSTLGRFAGSVAHEFNNPLFGLISLIEQLGGSLVDKDREKFSNLAQKECWRMANMIKNLQSFYKPSDGKVSSLSFENLIDETLLIAKKALKEKKIRVTKDYNTDRFQFNGIEDQIKQVILNLLQNAIDSIPDNGNGKITLNLSKTTNSFVLKICDNGVGIEDKNKKMIFDPFFTTKGKKGTGFGLSVSYGIVKNHGGDISVESGFGEGSIFTITLPI